MENILAQLGDEFERLDNLEYTVYQMRHLITWLEGETKNLHRYVKPFSVVCTLVVPIVVASLLGSLVPRYGSIFKFVYCLFLMLVTVIVVFAGFPNYIKSLRDAWKMFQSYATCRCTHRCHTHVGGHWRGRKFHEYPFGQRGDPLLVRGISAKILANMIRTSMVSCLMFLVRLLGRSVYICWFCKIVPACHCSEWASHVDFIEDEFFDEEDSDDDNLFGSDENRVFGVSMHIDVGNVRM